MEYGKYQMEPVNRLPVKKRPHKTPGSTFNLIQAFIESGVKYAEIKGDSHAASRVQNLKRIIKEQGLSSMVHAVTRRDNDDVVHAYLVRGRQKRGHNRKK
jgi:hypothetical protein